MVESFFVSSKVGVAKIPYESGRRILGPRIKKCLPTVYIRLTTLKFDKIKASWSKIDFLAFYLFNEGRGQKSGCGGPRILGPKINKMSSYSLYSTNHIPS